MSGGCGLDLGECELASGDGVVYRLSLNRRLCGDGVDSGFDEAGADAFGVGEGVVEADDGSAGAEAAVVGAEQGGVGVEGSEDFGGLACCPWGEYAADDLLDEGGVGGVDTGAIGWRGRAAPAVVGAGAREKNGYVAVVADGDAGLEPEGVAVDAGYAYQMGVTEGHVAVAAGLACA